MRKCRGSPLPPHPLLRVVNVYKPLSPPSPGTQAPILLSFPSPSSWALAAPPPLLKLGWVQGPFCIPLSALYLQSYPPRDLPFYLPLPL